MCQSVRVWDRGLEWFHLGKPTRSSGGDGELPTLAQHPSCLSLKASTPKDGRSPQISCLYPRDTVPNFISPVEVSAHPARCDTPSGYKKCSAPVQGAACTWRFPLPAHHVTLPRHQVAKDTCPTPFGTRASVRD